MLKPPFLHCTTQDTCFIDKVKSFNNHLYIWTFIIHFEIPVEIMQDNII
jgi:hypothetical protein